MGESWFHWYLFSCLNVFICVVYPCTIFSRSVHVSQIHYFINMVSCHSVLPSRIFPQLKKTLHCLKKKMNWKSTLKIYTKTSFLYNWRYGSLKIKWKLLVFLFVVPFLLFYFYSQGFIINLLDVLDFVRIL